MDIPTNSIKNEFNCSHCNKAVKTLRNLNNHVLRDTRETIYKRRNAAIQASMHCNVWGCFIEMFMKIYEQNVDNICMLELIYDKIFNKPREILIKMYESIWAMFENVQMVIL